MRKTIAAAVGAISVSMFCGSAAAQSCSATCGDKAYSASCSAGQSCECACGSEPVCHCLPAKSAAAAGPGCTGPEQFSDQFTEANDPA